MMTDRRPNLLFVFTDQHRYDAMSWCGAAPLRTPCLDEFAAQSTVFEQTYCTQPVCIPSRASLVTGLWPHSTGATHNVANLCFNAPCLPELLPDGAYETAYFGKWDLGDELFAQHGFDHWISTEDCYPKRYSPFRDQAARSSYHHFLIDHGYAPRNGDRFDRAETAAYENERVSKPAFLADEVRKWLAQVGERPFAAYVSFFEPHPPYFGPRNGLYDPADVTLPPDHDNPPGPENHPYACFAQRRAETQGVALSDDEPTPLDNPDAWRALIAQYRGLCNLVDHYIGVVLDAVRETGLWDDTVIVYTSDHGDMMGSRGMTNKSVSYEASARVPLMIKAADQHAARRVHCPMSQIDLVPTLLNLMGRSVPPHLPGASRADLVRGERDTTGDDVFMQWHGGPYGPWRQNDPEDADAFLDPWRAVVTPDNWKLTLSPGGWHELYDLGDDPLEKKNLARHPEGAARFDDLRARILHWMRNVRDPLLYLMQTPR